MEESLNIWVGKVAVVTGASSGIGAAISRKLVEHGLIVAGVARNEAPIEELARDLEKQNLKGSLHSFKCDITDEDDIKNTFEKIRETLGPLEVLVNNAGVLFDGSVLNADVKLIRKTFETNVISKCIAIKEAVKQMKTHNIQGQIININSVLGRHVYDIPHMNVYPATQFAVTALNETLRLELIREGSNIKVTNLSPGPVETKMFDPENQDPTKRCRAENTLKSKIKCFLKPSDVADAIIYILSTPPHVQVEELIIRPVGEPH